MSSYIRPTPSYTHPKKRRSLSVSLKSVKINWKMWGYIGGILGFFVLLGAIVDFAFVSNQRFFMEKIEVIHSGTVYYAQLPDADIVAQLKNKHYYGIKYRNILSTINDNYPFVSNLSLKQTNIPGSYQLYISYTPAQLMIDFANQTYGLVSGNLYPLQTLNSGIVLQIPYYFTGMTLSGLFYDIPAEQLVKQYQIIVGGLGINSISSMTYHPAAHQIQVNTPKQEIYFDIAGNVFEQLKKYRTLLEHQQQVIDQRVVDLGGVNDGAFVYP